MTTILFLGANPSDTLPLAIAEEVRDVKQRLFGTIYGSRYETPTELAVRVDDLQGHLLRYKPDIVHFSGHGHEDGRIILQGEDDRAVSVPEEALADLFALWSTTIRCVVLSACYSADQAAGIAEHVDCVVGMTRKVSDASATTFSCAFYQALGAGESLERAFALGLNAIDLKDLPDSDIPLLDVRSGASAGEIRFTEGAPPGWFEGPHRTPAMVVNHFMGRDGEIAELRRLLARESDAGCVVVTGLGGVGKASLVRHFVATEAPSLFPAGVAWLDGTQLSSELQRLARRFGWNEPQNLRDDDVLSWLAPRVTGWPLLFVVADVDLATFKVNMLPIFGGRCRTVITSPVTTLHQHLGVPAMALPLAPWEPATGLAYLHSVVPALPSEKDDVIGALTTLVGGLPLAIRLIVGLFLRPGATVEKVHDALRTQPLRWLEKAATGDDRGIAITFNAAFEHLDGAHQKVLLALAASARSTKTPVVAAVAGITVDDADEALVDIAESSLATLTDGAERPWSVHDVLRLYLRHQPGIDAVDKAHRDFATAQAEAHKAAKDWKAMDEQAPEVTTAIEVLRVTGDREGAAALVGTISPYLTQRGRYVDLASMCEQLIPLLPRGKALADLHARLGQSSGVMGKLASAVEHETAALAIYEEIDDRKNQAVTHKDLGLCFKILGDFPQAIDHLQRALGLGEALGDLTLQSKILASLGICFKSLGDLPKALDHHRRALAMAEALGDVQGQALDLTNLGVCFERLGDLPAAVEHHTRALAKGVELGDLRVQAIALGNLADCRRMMGDPAAAIDAAGQALALAERIGATEIASLVLAGTSDAHRDRGELPESLERGLRALALATRVGAGGAQAIALAALGRCYLAMGDLPRSLDADQRSLAFADKLGDPALQADAHENLALHHRAAGDPGGAAAEIRRALELYRSAGASDAHPEVRRLGALLDALPPLSP